MIFFIKKHPANPPLNSWQSASVLLVTYFPMNPSMVMTMTVIPHTALSLPHQTNFFSVIPWVYSKIFSIELGEQVKLVKLIFKYYTCTPMHVRSNVAAFMFVVFENILVIYVLNK